MATLGPAVKNCNKKGAASMLPQLQDKLPKIQRNLAFLLTNHSKR